MEYNVSGDFTSGNDCKSVTLNEGDICEVSCFEKPKLRQTGRVIELTNSEITLDMSVQFNSNIKKFDVNKIKDINIIT